MNLFNENDYILVGPTNSFYPYANDWEFKSFSCIIREQ